MMPPTPPRKGSTPDGSPAEPGRRPPGRHLLALIRPLVSRESFESIYVQAVRDLREEWEEIAEEGRPWSRIRVRLRGYTSLLTAAGAHVLFTVVDAATTGLPNQQSRAMAAADGPHGRIAMRTEHTASAGTPSLEIVTANDRFKRSFQSRLWGSIILATLLHLLFFTLFPTLTAADLSDAADEIVHVPPPDVDVPDAPEPLAHPALPVVGVDVPPDVTIPVNVLDDGGFPELPPPPESDDSARRAAPVLTPYTLRPRVKNREAVGRALEREYPPLLRDSGIDGRVVVWFFIDEEGRVQETRIHESSGHPSLDTAALDVGDVFEFTPAMNLDEAVPVWIQIPIVFDAR